MTDWLANLQWYWVVAAVVALLLLRLGLKRVDIPLAQSVSEVAESLAIAMALVFLIIRPFVAQAFYIPSASMRPTLKERDHILVNKFIYRLTSPKRGDVVVFKAPPSASMDGSQKDFVKRLLGLPGDTIEARAGYVTVNGEKFDHETLKQALRDGRMSQDEVSLKIVGDSVYLNGKPVDRKMIAEAFGMRGRKVDVRPGVVIRNGKPLVEPYTAEDPERDFGPEKVLPGTLLMMGDNRNNSNDSRSWGLLDRKRVLGKAMVVFWPLNRIGLVR